MNARLGYLGEDAAATATPSQRMQQQTQRVPPGALVQYYADLSSGVLPPEDMRIESIQFRVTVNPLGQITFQSQAVQVISRYNFAFRRIMGFALDPAASGAAPALISFNVLEQGRNFSVFKTPMNLQALMSTSGSGNLAEWDGVYITVPGTQIEVAWTIDTRWAALVGATREFGVQLMGDLVVCRPG